MSVKQQLPSLYLLYSIYKDVPEQTLDEADVDSYFYHNILDVAKTDNRLIRVSKGSNKNLVAINIFKFCDLKAQQPFFLDEEISITKKELAAVLNRLHHFLKQYDSFTVSKNSFSKVFRLHAVLHDAAGAVHLHNGRGPRYCYMIGRGPNSCLLGHVTGLLYCLYLKLFVASIFILVDF